MCEGGPVSPLLRRIAVNVAAWLVGAVASVAVGLLALSQIDVGFADGAVQPLSPDTLTRVVTEPPAPDAAGTPTGKAPPKATPGATDAAGYDAERALTSRGGSLVARCRAGRAYLASWSPAQGYHADDVRRGPALEARLNFEGRERAVAVSIRCVGGVPEASIHQLSSEHGHGVDD
jgi:hypothetical protein